MKSIFAISIFFLPATIIAQVFWSETFDGTICAAGSGCDPTLVSWTVNNTGVNGSTANTWYVSAMECGNAAGACGSTCVNDQSLHIGNVAGSSASAFWCPNGDCGASYDASSNAERTDKRAESPTIDCSGKTNITVDFNYIENGEGSNDNAEFWYYDGSTWTMLLDLPKTPTSCSPQGTWTAVSSISLPSSADNNPNVKIGFRWYNDGNGAGSDPSFAVDDITLTNNPPLPVIWLEINGKFISNAIKITFSTLSEINNDYFEILKSIDGINFMKSGKVKGNGNSNIYREYTFIDHEVTSTTPVYYYKIKQVDFDGRQTFSNIIAVNTKSEHSYLSINHHTYYTIPVDEGNIIRCYDLSGKLIYSGNKNNIQLPIKQQLILVLITQDDGKCKKYKLIIN